jgi:dTDP-4-dehydrorhamnose reductase
MSDHRTMLFTGGSGLLGTAFRRLLPDAQYPPSSALDVSSVESVESYLEAHDVDVIVHGAAFTSPPKVDQDPVRAIAVNVIGTANIARACARRSLRLVYISTDYVFRGTKGHYAEEDDVHPVNKYAWSKLGGECAVRLHDRSLIIRTSFGPDVFPYPKAFSDQWTSRQSVSETAKQMVNAIDSDLTGVLHIGGPRRTVLEYAKSLDPSREVAALSVQDVSFSVPVDTSLDVSRYTERFGR